MRTSQPVELDGDLSEPAWQEVAAADGFVQSEPYEGESATERTVVKVLYDEENLYIGAYCYDSQPSRIVVNSLKEDFDPSNGDSFEVILDTFHDSRNGFVFVTNPQGAKRDYQSANEGRTENADWDTVWDVRAKANGDGWSAEMVIPFKSLSFDEHRAEQLWGINFSRRIRRKNEIDFWAPIPRRYKLTRVSLAGRLAGLEGIERGRNLKVKPFFVTDVRKLAGKESTEWDPDGGLDVKYSLTPSLTLDLTGNTDFSQVEVDEQQVNLTRFPLFFPEKREFFLENEGIFQLGDIPFERGPSRSKETQLFFSRRIGLSDDGQPIPILGGARLSGEIGKYSLGVLNMQTQRAEDGTPADNFTVTRLKRDVLANSDIGAMFINRHAADGVPFHRAVGADANFRFGQNFTVNGFWAKTMNEGVSGDNSARKIAADYRSNTWRFQNVFSDIQDHFQPEVGFVERPGVRVFRSRNEWHPRPPRNRVFREFQPHYILTYTMDQSNRTLTKEHHIAFLQIFFHNGAGFEVHYDPIFDRLDRPFEIRDGVVIPPGDYHFARWAYELSSDPSRWISGSLNVARGTFYSGRRTTVDTTGVFRPNYRFSVEATYSHNDVDLPEGAFVSRLVRARINYFFSTRMFLSALVQYNNERQQVTSNIRFNFIHHPLSDLFLVYNEQRDVSGNGRNDHAFTIKLTHMLAF